MKLPAGLMSKVIVTLAAVVAVVAIAMSGYSCVGLFQDSTSKSPYFVSQSNTSLQVQTDGSIHASDQRTYQVQGDVDHIVWNMGLIAEKKMLKVDSVRLSTLDEAGKVQQTHNLDKAAFDPAWKTGGSPLSIAAYGIDPSNSQIHIFTGKYAKGGTSSFLLTLDYVIDQAVIAYRDVSEFEWTVVSGSNDAATKNATLTVSLPAPVSDASMADSIYAWSHGPEGSSLAVQDDGGVSYSIGMVDVWQFADVRLDFPTAWLTSMPKELSEPHANELNLEYAKKQEKDWIDTWHGRTANSYLYDMVIIALCALAALFALAVYMRYGKSRKPDFVEMYSNDDPTRQKLHPSVVGRIWRWDRKSVDDLRAALVRLVSLGAVDVRNEGDASASGKDRSAVAGYRLTMVPAVADALEDPIDQQTLRLLFTVVANKSKDVRVQEIRSFKRDHADKYKAAVDEWQKALDQQTDGERYIEKAGKRWQVRLVLLAVLVAAIGVALFLLFGHPVVLATSLSSAVVIALLANYVPRRTVEGNNIAARSKALRNWMRDSFEASGVMPGEQGAAPLSQLMPFASVFGTTKEALAKASGLREGMDNCDPGKLDEEDVHWRICYVVSELRKEESAHGVHE